MKRILLLCALLASFSVQALQDIPIASADRATGVTVDSADLFGRPVDQTLHVVLLPTVVTGAASATISVDAKSPQGTYYNIITSAATALTANTPVIIKVGIGLTAAANSVATDMVPPVYRIRAVVSGLAGTAATFTVARNIN